jgi:hypothetical protein
MAKRASIFGDEWRRCLKEHYKYVVKKQDKATESTLVPILQRFGFNDDDLRHLYVEATMRDMPDDFLPDVDGVFQQAALTTVPEATFTVHPAECTCPSCMDVVLEEGHDSEGQPLEQPLEVEEPAGNLFPVAKPEKAKKEDKDEKPKQKRLF